MAWKAERLLGPLLFLAAAGPLARLLLGLGFGGLGANPVETLTHWTGLSGLILLLVTLSVTPLQRWLGWNKLVRHRRMLGLWSFTYVTLHFLVYAVFDHVLDPGEILADVAEHPWVLVGFSAFVLLIPLAVTSTNGMIRRLGGARWRRLHRLSYVAASLGVLHFLWQVKADTREPLIYAAVLVALLAARLRWGRAPGTRRTGSRARAERAGRGAVGAPLPPREA